MRTIKLRELEDCLNFWRDRRPSTGTECALSAEVNALGSAYGELIFRRKDELPESALSPAQLNAYQSWKNAVASSVA